MLLLTVGINHKTAPIALRERVAITPERLVPTLQQIVHTQMASEVAIVSTCNRTELYCGLPQEAPRLIDWWSRYHAVAASDLQPHVYQHPDQRAVQHLLRVASGLDSMVLGEPQILGQIKSAYQAAAAAGTLGTVLNRLFQHSFSVAKQVRTDTCIGASPVSVAFAAIRLAKQIFAPLRNHKALLIGAGETVELVARHLHEQGIGRLIIANRTLERAHHLAAPFAGYAIQLPEIAAHLAEVDLVIAATASPSLIVTAAQVKAALKQRRYRPLLLIDLAVPRNIDPAIRALADVYLYTVDDLHAIIQENLQSRRAAAEQAEDIIARQVDQFMSWVRAQNSAKTIRTLRQQAEQMRDEVHRRALKQLQGGKTPEEVLRYLATTLTNKLIHAPCVSMRKAAAVGRAEVIEWLHEVYGLDATQATDDTSTDAHLSDACASQSSKNLSG